jgi:hypothetical protein
MMVYVDAMQLSEFEEGLRLFKADQEMLAFLQTQNEMMESVIEPRLFAAEKSSLFAALDLALAERQNDVAETLLRIAKETHRGGAAADASLIKALAQSSSLGVRVRAAVTLAQSQSDLPATAKELAASVLAEAILNAGVRIAHKIMGNADYANRFEGLFRELAVESHSNSRSVEEGLIRASSLPPDVIVVDSQIPSATAPAGLVPVNHLVNLLRKRARTAEIPVIVVLDAGRFEQERPTYENKDKKVLVVPHDIDKVELKNSILDTLLDSSEDAQAKALELGNLAAATIEELSGNDRGIPVTAVIAQIEQALMNRPDSIRLPLLTALGNLRARVAASVPAISQLFAATENSVEIREAAMLAIGRILDASDGPVDPAVVSIIKEGMGEKDLRLKKAAAFAFSTLDGIAGEATQLYKPAPGAGPSPSPSAGAGAATEAASGGGVN